MGDAAPDRVLVLAVITVLDISHHQNADVVPWRALADLGGALYIRACYGRTRDRLVQQHWARAKEHGIPCGLYAFFRASQPAVDQIDAFTEVASLVDYGPGDLIPGLDIEADGKLLVEPWWSGPAREFADVLVDLYTNAKIYITQREFAMLGKPAWVLERPLWVAHHTSKPAPATPGNAAWSIWQYRVGPWDPSVDNRRLDYQHPRALDHNIARELIRIREVWQEPEPRELTAPMIPLELTEEDYEAMRRERALWIEGT